MWIVIETFPSDSMYILTDENGGTLVFENFGEALSASWDLQDGLVVKI
jgi:hypothetical protein